MPRVVRDVIRIRRTIRSAAREPPDEKILRPVAPRADPDRLLPDGLSLAQEEDSLDIVEWQIFIVIHTVPDASLA